LRAGTRALKRGYRVDETIWKQVQDLASGSRGDITDVSAV
jgi:hypothetical protein